MEEKGPEIDESGTGARTFRMFVAIVLPGEVRDRIEQAQRELRDAVEGGHIRWTKREQFHLTLKFLGNVESSRVAELTQALRSACVNFATFRLRAAAIGFFPHTKRPRVIWVGVHDEKDVLLQVQQAVETATQQFTTEKPEGRFAGHVTLGRIQQIKPLQAEKLVAAAAAMADRFFGEWLAEGIELIRSELSSSGSRYTTLAAIPFSTQS